MGAPRAEGGPTAATAALVDGALGVVFGDIGASLLLISGSVIEI